MFPVAVFNASPALRQVLVHYEGNPIQWEFLTYPASTPAKVWIVDTINLEGKAVKRVEGVSLILLGGVKEGGNALSLEPLASNCVLLLKRPFRLASLLKMVESFRIQLQEKEEIVWKNYRLHLPTRELRPLASGHSLQLTQREVEILLYLYKAFPEAVSREALLKEVWHYQEGIDTHTVESHIYRLRQKMEEMGEEAFIVTQADGYKLKE